MPGTVQGPNIYIFLTINNNNTTAVSYILFLLVVSGGKVTKYHRLGCLRTTGMYFLVLEAAS